MGDLIDPGTTVPGTIPSAGNHVIKIDTPPGTARMVISALETASVGTVRTETRTGRTVPIAMDRTDTPVGTTRNHDMVTGTATSPNTVTANPDMKIAPIRARVHVMIATTRDSAPVTAVGRVRSRTVTAQVRSRMVIGRVGSRTVIAREVDLTATAEENPRTNRIVPIVTETRNHVMALIGMTRGRAITLTMGTATAQANVPAMVPGTVITRAGNPMATGVPDHMGILRTESLMATAVPNPMEIVEEDNSTGMIAAAGRPIVMIAGANRRTVIRARNPTMTGAGNLMVSEVENRPIVMIVGEDPPTVTAKESPHIVMTAVGNHRTETIAMGNHRIVMTAAGKSTPVGTHARTATAEETISPTQTGIRLTAIRAGTARSPRTALANGPMVPETGIVRGLIRKTIRARVMTPSAGLASSRGSGIVVRNHFRPAQVWRRVRMSRPCPYSMKT